MDESDIFSELYSDKEIQQGKKSDAGGKDGKIPQSGPPIARKRKVRKKRKSIFPGILLVVLILGIVALGFFLIRTGTCAFGHRWLEATCTRPKICENCGQIEGESLGHKPGAFSCTEQTKCLVCDAVLREPEGHFWNAFDQGCTACGEKLPAGYIIPQDAVSVSIGDTTHFYKVFAISANKWAANYCQEEAILFPFTRKITWEDAVDVCQSQGGRIAEITSEEIQNAVYSQLIEGRYPDITVYFGLTDREEEGQWVWLSGEEVSYLNWRKGQPDGKKYENHAGFYAQYKDGAWRDGKFTEDTRYFICEWMVPNR